MSKINIIIDDRKCNQCGLCVKDCISGCLYIENEKPVCLHPEWCNLCSHCIAVCPKDAIDHSGLAGMPPYPVQKSKLDHESYKNIVMTRRSIRRFKDRAVPDKTIEDILKCAAYSPTASNSLNVGFTVVTNKELIRKTGLTIFKKLEKLMIRLKKPPLNVIVVILKLFIPKKTIDRYLDRQELFSSWVKDGRDVITHDAPVLILVHGPKKDKFGEVNSAIAACNITNYAHAKGLGTCYIGFITALPESSRKKIKGLIVPEGRKIYSALVLGYPDHKYQKTTIRPEPSIEWIR